MELIKGQKLHGFTVTNARHIDELGADLYELVHDATGAQLCWFNDGDENKLFSVTFKTIPEDSTGVFHILEHTVLNGSDRYPVKEPFVELLKGSLNTFLNAMTFPDKTLYPVSSRNHADFINLTRVYLDSVFHPLIGKNQNIFRQEGWHIELENKDAQPVYKGVVFNEMKGAMSSIDDVVETGVSAMLFPESPYRHNSGGDPEVIPTLTYEKYLDTYRRFYHPSNARFWLDGALPIDETLALINDEYLSNYTRRDEAHDIPVQPLLDACEMTVYSELGEGEEAKDKTQLVYARIAADWDEFERIMAINILCDALCGSNDAPLTRAILEKGLGQDVSMDIQDGMLQAILALQIQNTENANEAAVRETIRETVKQLLTNGIDRAELEAIINKTEFDSKQPHEPQGLIRAIRAMNSWLYGGDPADGLVCEKIFASLRAKLSTRYWEELLAELMDEKHLCLLRVLPSETLGAERRQKEQEKLKAISAAWSEREREEAADITAKLIAWQQTPDSPEALATIPKLPLSEIDPEPEFIDTQEKRVLGARLISHKLNCKGVVHANLYFCLNGCDYETASLLPELLGELPTEKHDVRSLVREMKRVIGDYSFSVCVTNEPQDTKTCSVWLNVRFSALADRMSEAEALITEVLTQTKFDDFDRIKELVLQSDENLRQALIGAGDSIGVRRAAAGLSAASAMNEILRGVKHMQWIRSLAGGFDARAEQLALALNEILSTAVCRERMALGIAADGEFDAESFIAGFPEGTTAPENVECTIEKAHREAVVIPAQICYAGMAFPTGGIRHGSSFVLRNAVTYNYLWNEVRVKGGAYGCGMRPVGPEAYGLTSFRDPTADRTIKTFRATGAWLKDWLAHEPPVENSVISAIGSSDRLTTVRDKAALADDRVLCGVTDEQRRARRAELIGTTAEELERWIPMLSSLDDADVCVVGSRAAIDACTDEDLTIVEI